MLHAVPKVKNVRLRGKKKKALRTQIFERDNCQCVICGREAKDWHHQPFGSNKSDELEKGVALCHECHMDLHHSAKHCAEYQKIVHDYLEGLYGELGRKNE